MPVRWPSRLIATLREPFVLDNGVSAGHGTGIGMALSAMDGSDINGLIHYADAALNRVKMHSTDGFHFSCDAGFVGAHGGR